MFVDPPKQEKLVEILQWVLMPNHYHLLLVEKTEGGITEFMKRLGNSFTKYINIKYKRSGYLFQNKAQILLLENDAHFLYIPYYIDLNPLDLKFINWKKDGLLDCDSAVHFLEEYRWSSRFDYVRCREYRDVINRELFYEIFDLTEEDYNKEMKDIIVNPIQKMESDFLYY
ncbi:MAG: transposase [Candidatus Paceibacterota bacterium]|jgi:putative transposase